MFQCVIRYLRDNVEQISTRTFRAAGTIEALQECELWCREFGLEFLGAVVAPAEPF